LIAAADPTIRVERLGKRYEIAPAHRSYPTLRERVSSLAVAPFRPLFGARYREDLPTQEFWALRDVTFDVQRGEVFGVIGPNGAGKSTLLRLLSRITEPTEGNAWIHGSTASLLELGMGFHPELTGRENVLLNGAILGIPRKEMLRQFDQIVAYSGLDRFMNTPVKRYSSGMYIRLAFAVAAQLDSAVLIVDEVLAVGDIEFQAKTIGTMEGASRHGRTILFTSHNMADIRRICHRCLVLEQGQVAFVGDVESAIDFYTDQMHRLASRRSPPDEA
jgi:lipopolysaccharide transport system ATP-binding protein